MSNSASTAVIELRALLEHSSAEGAIWSHTSEQLNLNLVHFRAGQGVDDHRNDEVDIVGIVVEGECELVVDGVRHTLRAGQLFLIPRGRQRSLTAVSPRFAYVSCHVRRPGLMPAMPEAQH